MYPIDPQVAESKRIRKYGFHGLSYAYIIRAVASFLKKGFSRVTFANALACQGDVNNCITFRIGGFCMCHQEWGIC